MDAKLKEKLFELMLDIDLDLRSAATISQSKLEQMNGMLKEINQLSLNDLISRQLMKYFWSVYTHMLSTYCMWKINDVVRRSVLKEGIIIFEQYVLDHLDLHVTDKTEQDPTINELKRSIQTLQVDQVLIDLLEKIRTKTINEQLMSRTIAYYLFLLQKEMLWNSYFFEDVQSSWEELEETDLGFEQYVFLLRYLDEIFEMNMRL